MGWSGGHLSLGTMIIKCRTREREREGGGGHLSLGTMIIKCRARERERGGGVSLVSRNNVSSVEPGIVGVGAFVSRNTDSG